MTDNLESDKPDTSNEEVALLAEKKNEDASDKKEQEKENVVIKFLRLNKSFRIPALSLFILLILVIIAGLGYFCWYLWLTPLWKWGFEPFTWRSILSVLGAFYLVIIPFIPLTFIEFIGDIVNLYLEEQEALVSESFSTLDKGQKSIEEELKNGDEAGLIPLIIYSRFQLEAYYRIGLDQTGLVHKLGQGLELASNAPAF